MKAVEETTGKHQALLADQPLRVLNSDEIENLKGTGGNGAGAAAPRLSVTELLAERPGQIAKEVAEEGQVGEDLVIPGVDGFWLVSDVKHGKDGWFTGLGRWIASRTGRRKQAAETKKKNRVSSASGEAAGELRPNTGGGAVLRSSASKAGRGWYAPITEGSPSTTRQADVLNTALIAAPTGFDGTAVGRDVLSKTGVFDDPFTGYNANPRRVTSTNVLVVGNVGAGKSSFTKTVFVLRPVIRDGIRAVVYDKKANWNPELGIWEGEYSEICRFFTPEEARRRGILNEPIRCTLDAKDERATKLNIFDPSVTGLRTDSGGSALMGYLENLSLVLRPERATTTVRERKMLRVAYRKMMGDLEGRRQPTAADLAERLGSIDRTDRFFDGAPTHEVDRLEKAGWELRAVFNELLENYGTIFDGETSKNVSLGREVTSFDISQLPDAGPSIPLVMGLSNLWLMGQVRATPGVKTDVVVEEAWHILSTPMAAVQRSNIKLSRSLGLSNIYNIHKLDDIPEGSNGMAVYQEAQTVHVFRQDKKDIAEETARRLGLHPENVPTMMKLGNGQLFRKAGSAPEVLIEHIRSPWEVRMTDTDVALKTTTATKGAA